MTSSETLIAGFTASALTTLLLHPIDVIRITQIAHKTTIRKTIQNIYSGGHQQQQQQPPYRKILNFYRALPISMFAYIATYSIYFPLNTYLKADNPLNLQNKYLIYTFATIPPSLIGMTCCNPFWTIKSKQISFTTLNQQHQRLLPSTTSSSTSSTTTVELLTLQPSTKTIEIPKELEQKKNTIFYHIKNIYETSGYRGFYKGVLFGYINSLNGILTFTLYDIIKDIFRHSHRLETTTATGKEITTNLPQEIVIASIASKTLATMICYPILVARIRQQVDQTTISTTIQNLWQGRHNIYNGLFCSLLQQLPKNTIMLCLYEFVLTIISTQ